MTTVYDFAARSLSGEDIPLGKFRGKVLLIANTASKCGFTPQYAGLEKLRETLGPRGFEVLGFPCNQFGGQEPGNAEEIASFCALNYGVTFPMFAKVDVNGARAHPLFKFLKGARPGTFGFEAIKWNFTKFLVNRNGVPVGRFSPMTRPEDLQKSIEELL
jgi:glutathione peroxidase